jgi:hypothetical protein
MDKIKQLDRLYYKWLVTLRGKNMLHDFNADICTYGLTKIIYDNPKNPSSNYE